MLGIALGSLLVSLLLRYWTLRATRKGLLPPPSERITPPARSRERVRFFLVGGVMLAQLPFVPGALRFLRAGILPPDAISHATVARDLVRDGLPHGWINTYEGGFPFGIHYQSVALLLDAALVKLGLPPTVATDGLGVLALFTAPIAFAWAADRGGLPPLASLAGAIVVATVAPEHPMVGGWEAYLTQGLLSQVVAIPILILCAGAVVSSVSARWVPWLAALAVAAHTQVTVVAFAAALPAVLASGTPAVRRRFFFAAAAASVAAVALYGAGALNFAVPFGAPRVLPWRIVGFPLDRLTDGDLLDHGRVPILTAAAVTAAGFLLPLVHRRAARGALLLLATTALVTFGRQAFLGIGAAGLLEMTSPGRAMALVPLAGALAVAIALRELDVHLCPLLGRKAPRWILPAPLAAAVMVLAILTLPERIGFLREEAAGLDALSGAEECGPTTPAGYTTRLAEEWVATLDRGRFEVDFASFDEACPAMHGLDLASAIPLGANVGGPGSQVGVLALAYGAFRLAPFDSAGVAEALGIRDVLGSRAQAPTGAGWTVRASHGDMLLFERSAGTDLVGVGCVVEAWSGTNRSLREALMSGIEAGAPWLATPASLIALDEARGPLERGAVDRAGCDASGASVVERRREPGALEAVVSSASDVDVVLRATYFATWEVRVDGAVAAKRRVAPGFISARVPAGVHHIEATVRLPRGSLFGLFVACGCLALLARALRDREQGLPRARPRLDK